MTTLRKPNCKHMSDGWCQKCVTNLELDCIEECIKVEEERDRLRDAIKAHRAQRADDRCWMDDVELYRSLGDGDVGDNRIGDRFAMLSNCLRFINQRCADGGPWKPYAELEGACKRFREALQLIRKTVHVSTAQGIAEKALKGEDLWP